MTTEIGTDRSQLPVDPASGKPLAPHAQPGYYPDFQTLSQASFWDEATRNVVMTRMHEVPPIRFFSEEELKIATAVFDRIIPQDDRDAEHRIPVINYVDDRLYCGLIDGYRYDQMPPDREAYRLGLRGIDEVAHCLHGKGFVELGVSEQEEVLWTLHDANPPKDAAIFQQVPAERFWLLLMSDAVHGYYQHPYAWDEVGFGGPAYPRGYFRLRNGQREPWEVNEQRYAWEPPPSSSSGEYRSLGGEKPSLAAPGQEGSH